MLIDEDKLKKVVEYVNSSHEYSFEKFIDEHNLGKDSVQRAFDVVIKCPFHVDYAPSCSMNDSIHVFNCFSCGRKGSYIKFRALYDTEIEGISTGYYQEANNLLRSDSSMQAALGFSSIYKKTTIPSVSARPERFHVRRDPFVPSNFLELSSLLMKEKCSDEDKILCILLMQQGLPVEEVYREIFKNKRSVPEKKNYDIDSLFEMR